MKIITAVEKYEEKDDDVLVFLAGGITDCPDWQKDVIECAKEYDEKHVNELDKLVLFNPRRPNFPIGNQSESKRQIEWEFNWLQKMDVFSMYFTGGDSDQPICLYELGRNLSQMMQEYTCDYDRRIVISVSKDYNRFEDVVIQTNLAWGRPALHSGTTIPKLRKPCIFEENNPQKHFTAIVESYQYVKGVKEEQIRRWKSTSVHAGDENGLKTYLSGQ